MEDWKNIQIEDLEGEVWKDIVGYEGYYQISNKGRVKSLKRTYITHEIERVSHSYKIIRQAHDKKGYLVVSLHKYNKSISKKVHRLVAVAFIHNKLNKYCVCHIDNNPSNNNVNNLYWGTVLENNTQARNDGLYRNNKQIKQYSKDGIFINIYKSQSEASRITGIPQSNIWKCYKGIRKSAGGYLWQE